MRTAQKIVATALILALLAAAYGIFSLGRSAMVSATKKTSDAALVDQTPFKTAQQLAQLADTPEEQELAKETLRISDYELDQSFALALQDAEAHPPALSAEAKLIQQRLQKNQRLQQALEAQVDQLTAQVAKATGARKSDLQDQLDIAEASLDVADNDVDDANRDLASSWACFIFAMRSRWFPPASARSRLASSTSLSATSRLASAISHRENEAGPRRRRQIPQEAR